MGQLSTYQDDVKDNVVLSRDSPLGSLYISGTFLMDESPQIDLPVPCYPVSC